MTVDLVGHEFTNAGIGINGATVDAFTVATGADESTASTSATASTTTDSSGKWAITGIADGVYDVRIKFGSEIRWLRGEDQIQIAKAEVSTAVKTQDAADVMFGSGEDALIRWSTGDADNHSLVIAVGDSNQSLHITDKGAVATDWAISATTHPNVYVHSNTTPATDYLRLGDHDGTTAYVDVVGGTTLALEIAGNTELTVTSAGVDIAASNSYAVDGTAILSDSSGTMTLSNVDALDATTEATIEGAIDTLSNLASVGTITTGVWQGTDVGVAYGGTGASTLTANGVLVGNGSSAIGSVDMSTKGHVLIGDGSGNPQMLGVGTDTHVLTADSGETTGVKWAAPAAAAAGSLTGSTLASGVTASSLTSLGTLTALTVDNVAINGSTIGHTGDTDLITVASGTMTLAGTIDMGNNAINNIGAAGNDWAATRLNMSGSNDGGDQLVHIENTSNTAGSDSQIDLHVGGTSAGDPKIIYSVEGIAGGYAVMGVDTSSSATVPQFAIGRSTTVGGNDALRISYATPPIVSYNTSHPTGTFDYVCESCGRHQAATFACCGTVGWHDDVLDYRAMALRESSALDYMERVGVIERGVNNDGDPEIFTLLGRDFEFAMSAAWQNRQRMDTQYEDLDRRLAAIGA